MGLSSFVVFALLTVVLAVLVTFYLTRKQEQTRAEAVSRELEQTKTTLLTARAEFEAHREELRNAITDAHQRENEAKAKVKESEQRCDQLGDELKIALEEKGRFQNEAVRVEEARDQVAERDNQIQTLQLRIEVLDRERFSALKDAEAANKRAEVIIAKEGEKQTEVIRAKDEQINKLNEFVGNAREVLTTEFKALSADALKNATDQLIQTADGLIEKHGEASDADIELHRQQIQTMLKPVEETIKRLDKHVEDSDKARSNAEAVLDAEVKRLAGASELLTNALRKPVVRGSWGEMTLENALESAGLEPEIDFVLQHTTDAEDGRKRTDAVVNLPKGRKLVIDSKNMMESYIAFANTTDEAQKRVLAEAHSRALRAHIKALWGQEYWKRYEGLDCVILFIPHEGMYHAAIREEDETIREASEKRVFIANPMTLVPLLKSVRYVLNQEKLNKSAEEISSVGTELYAEITRFADNMSTIGDRLRATVKSYNDAIPGLDRFIVSKSRKLKQLGAAKGDEPETPETVELEPREFSSQELRTLNSSNQKSMEPEVAGAVSHS